MKRRLFLQGLLALVGCGFAAPSRGALVEAQCFGAAEFTKKQLSNFFKRKSSSYDDRVYFWNGREWKQSDLSRQNFGAGAFRETGQPDA